MSYHPQTVIITPGELQTRLGADNLVIVDLCKPEIYTQAHLPGAFHIDYKSIISGEKPVLGLLPAADQFSAVLSAIGATNLSTIIAYDDEGGGRAARFLWTLEVIGHAHYALLDGGLAAWVAESRPLTTDIPPPASSNYPIKYTDNAIANLDYVRANLGNPKVVLMDTRTAKEFSGEKSLAARPGHIPGAINFDWVNAMDPSRNLRLKDKDSLRADIEALGITRDKEIIVYCQTHHRSAHTFVVLKHLGYQQLRGYAGAWSEWGNRQDTPIKTGVADPIL